MLGYSATTLNVYGTFIFSALSLLGSILVIFSYIIARTISKPRAARLILNLAIADFVWFLTSFVQASIWVMGGNPGQVPANLCYICGPLVNLGRLSSLLWTSVVAFEVLQSVKKSKWATEVEKSEYYDLGYFVVIYVLSSPGAIFNIYKQHESSDNGNLGCDPGYEAIGTWYVVLFTELIPIMLGFSFNVFVFAEVHRRMSTRKYPQSVRKRRKRIMYHYLLVCIICWLPTIAHYGFELAHVHSVSLQVISRCSLYSTGFLNFLVFGMQDPHLKRSFRAALEFCGLAYCLQTTTTLRRNSIEKTVMFDHGEKTNADIAKDKKSVYRNNRLSREDKAYLFTIRPDLDLRSKNDVDEPLLDKNEQNMQAAPKNRTRLRSGDIPISKSKSEKKQSKALNKAITYLDSRDADVENPINKESSKTKESIKFTQDNALEISVTSQRNVHTSSNNNIIYGLSSGSTQDDDDMPYSDSEDSGNDGYNVSTAEEESDVNDSSSDEADEEDLEIDRQAF